VDKTRPIHQLVTSGKYYFLSRPRRFGKSGLWVENHWDWSIRLPVIHLSFGGMGYKEVFSSEHKAIKKWEVSELQAK